MPEIVSHLLRSCHPRPEESEGHTPQPIRVEHTNLIADRSSLAVSASNDYEISSLIDRYNRSLWTQWLNNAPHLFRTDIAERDDFGAVAVVTCTKIPRSRGAAIGNYRVKFALANQSKTIDAQHCLECRK